MKTNIKISSINLASIRSAWKKGFLDWIDVSQPDIICIQETKMHDKAEPGFDTLYLEGYCGYFFDSFQAGQSGTAIYTKFEPISKFFIPNDKEGRTLVLEFQQFYLINSYVPNAGMKLERLDYKVNTWNPQIKLFLNDLRNKKPIIWTGDLNVAHEEIDIFDPKGHDKTAGYTPQERNWFHSFLSDGYIDIFRYLYPEKKEFTFFSYRANAKIRNRGWRLDYFIIHKENIKDNLIIDCFIEKGDFSDHIPLSLILNKDLMMKNDQLIKETSIFRLNNNQIFIKSKNLTLFNNLNNEIYLTDDSQKVYDSFDSQSNEIPKKGKKNK